MNGGQWVANTKSGPVFLKDGKYYNAMGQPVNYQGSMPALPSAPVDDTPKDPLDELSKPIREQVQATRLALDDSMNANRHDIESAFGNITWDRPEEEGGTWTQRQELSPELQAQLDRQSARSEQLDSLASQLIGQRLDLSGLPEMPTSLNVNSPMPSLDFNGLPELNKDYSADAAKVEQATYDRAMQLMQPGIDENRRRLENRLATQGIPLGGEAYETEMNRFDRGVNEASLAAALESVGAGRQEQSRLFGIDSAARGQGFTERVSGYDAGMNNRRQDVSEQLSSADLATRGRQQGVADRVMERQQPLNELAMVLGSNQQLPFPEMPGTAQYQVAAPDVLGYNAQRQAAKAAKKSSMLGGLAGLAGSVVNTFFGGDD